MNLFSGIWGTSLHSDTEEFLICKECSATTIAEMVLFNRHILYMYTDTLVRLVKWCSYQRVGRLSM